MPSGNRFARSQCTRVVKATQPLAAFSLSDSDYLKDVLDVDLYGSLWKVLYSTLCILQLEDIQPLEMGQETGG